MSASPSEPNLTFQWPAEQGFPFVLFVCVAGSLFAHVATFFLFRVVYPQHVTIPHPAPYVSLLTPSSPENIALLRWIEAEDPALIAPDNAVPPPGLMAVRYQPSFAVSRTAPLGAPEEKPQEINFPPAGDRLLVPLSAVTPVPPPAPRASTTEVRFADTLSKRALVRNPPVEPARSAPEPVKPTVLLVGVNAAGEVPFQWLQQASGNPALDDLAVAHLRRLGFAPMDVPIMWGHVTFSWGTDAYVSSAPAEEAPRSVP